LAPASDVSLRPVLPDERPVLENLVQLYCHDWSDLVPLEIGPDGRFHAIPLDPYWTDDWRHPLLVRLGETIAGFALIDEKSRLTGDPGVHVMAEFFVLRAHRRRGVGLAAAFAAFDRFKGPWEIRQREENPAATTFWRRAVGEYTRGNYREVRWEGPAWSGPVQTFES
jgi:predicted acetyltransferase